MDITDKFSIANFPETAKHLSTKCYHMRNSKEEERDGFIVEPFILGLYAVTWRRDELFQKDSRCGVPTSEGGEEATCRSRSSFYTPVQQINNMEVKKCYDPRKRHRTFTPRNGRWRVRAVRPLQSCQACTQQSRPSACLRRAAPPNGGGSLSPRRTSGRRPATAAFIVVIITVIPFLRLGLSGFVPSSCRLIKRGATQHQRHSGRIEGW